jgi:hypothetical protein
LIDVRIFTMYRFRVTVKRRNTEEENNGNVVLKQNIHGSVRKYSSGVYVERGSVITQPDPTPFNSGLMAIHLKGLGHEINFKNMDGNGQIRASIRDAAGQRTAWATDLMRLLSPRLLITLIFLIWL